MKMTGKILVLALLLAASVAGWAEDKVYLFDMGPTNSPVWPGFTLVTAKTLYTAERGYGLSSTGEIFDVLNVAPDDLCTDFVEVKGKEPLEFKVDLPNGEYEVCVMTGDDLSGQSASRWHLWQQIRITAEGKEVFRKQRDVFALQDVDYVPGQSIWEKYIKDRYLIIQFGVKVEDGQLNLSFEGLNEPVRYAFPLNCVMIYPASAKKRMESDLSEINAKRQQVFEKQWTKITPDKENPSFQAEAGDVERGYLAWPKNYLEMVWPETVPNTWERGDVIETYASKGEWESISFCVRALRPMTNAMVSVSDLKCGNSVIAATNVRVSVVKYEELANRHAKTYMVGPYTLMEWKKVDLPAELTKQWWLKIHVPESVADGIYEGTVTVAPENAVKLAMRLRLRVLPFSLIRSPYVNFFYFATRADMSLEMQGRNDYSDKEFRGMYGKEVDFLRERNFWPKPDCSLVRIDVDKTARVVKKINFEWVDKQMELLKEFNALPQDRFLVNHAEAIGIRLGIMKWIQIQFPESERVFHVEFSDVKEDLDMFIDVCRQVDAYIREKGYGVPVFEVGGELSNYQKNDEGLKFGMTAYGALKRAGVLTGLRGNGAFDLAIMKAGLVDYAIPNLALVRDEQTAIMNEKCKGLWLYNFSNGRYGYGFFAWKKGATRRPHEMGVIGGYGMPWDPFNAGALGTGYVGAEPTRDGLASRIYFERMAEGCDDYDYLYTCEQLIKRSEQSGLSGAKSAAVAARRTLEFIGKNTFTDYNFMGDAMAGSGISWDAGCRWAPDDFQKYRWMVAREIIKLQKALGDSK